MATDIDRTDSGTRQQPAALSHRDKTAKLSRSGLVAMLVAMFIVPIATVLNLWYYLPPVSQYQLEAEVQFANLETAKEFVRRVTESLVKEPKVIAKNTGTEPWTRLIIELNHRYKIDRTDSAVAPGESLESGLDLFQTREGLFFPPGRIPLKHIRVYARLPSGSRATYELDLNK